MKTIIGLLFCLLLGVMVRAQGWFALLWFPIGFVVGVFVGILLSPLSKKSRADFRADFDRSYGRFYTSFCTSSELPPQQKYVDAVIKVGSNLYLQTIPGGDNAAPLLFSLQYFMSAATKRSPNHYQQKWKNRS